MLCRKCRHPVKDHTEEAHPWGEIRCWGCGGALCSMVTTTALRRHARLPMPAVKGFAEREEERRNQPGES